MASTDPSLRERVDEALDTVASGARPSLDEAELLLGARGSRLERLLELASSLRDVGLAAIGRPGVITYSRKVFLPVTTLCQDRCHYCIFVDTPLQLLAQGKPVYMSREQVLTVAREGAALGCKEALFTLGDRPENRWPAARDWLDANGYASTMHYLADMALAVRTETGLMPHLNPGVMSAEEMEFLRPFAPSMGMMLETTSERLWSEKGQVHYGSPDKEPRVRLQVLEDAGRARIPFTTGILVGIGETLRDRAHSLEAIRASHERHGHVQEVIVQNFRAKPRTAMAHAPDAELIDYIATIAVARVIMGADARIQVPPNLSDPAELELLVRAGVDDWGGISPLTADHVNPERPWPHIDDLAARTRELGFELRERLTAHAPYLRDAAQWIDDGIAPELLALADTAGLAAATHVPQRSLSMAAMAPSGAGLAPAAHLSPLRSALARASTAPARLTDKQYCLLLTATGNDLDALTALANDLRRYTVGEAVSFVANRNLTSTQFGTSGPDGFDLDDVVEITRDAWQLGATELCVQGVIAGPASGYAELARAVKVAAPGIHLHAYRPADVWDYADRLQLSLSDAMLSLREAGVDSMPGTGVKILNERVRAKVAPADLPVDHWREVITAAHAAGLATSSVMFYGHVESAAQRVAHIRTLIEIQDQTGGFTEFVPIPLPGWGTALVTGRSDLDEHRAVHAVSRLMLHGHIAHVQVPWTRVGFEASAVLLRSGADDLGGTLFDGRVRPGSGAERGLELSLAEATRITSALFRPLRQRTTSYGEPPSARKLRS